METIPEAESKPRRSVAHEVFRVSEFDEIVESWPVGDVLRANLESAEAQLRLEQRRARRAERRVKDLWRAVDNWHELIDVYEQATHSAVDDRRN